MAKKPRVPRVRIKPSRKKTTKDEKIEAEVRMWQNRVRRGIRLQTPWWHEGRQYKEFIEGNQWPDFNEKQDPDWTWSRTTANRMSPLVNGFKANLIFRSPAIEAKPIRAGEDAAGRAQVNSDLINYSFREFKARNQLDLAIDDAIVYGAGFIETDYDNERKIPRLRWRSAENVIVDPDANTTVDSMRWICVRESWDIKTAREHFKAPTLQADALQTTDEQGRELSAHTTSVGKGRHDHDRANSGDNHGRSDRVTIFRIFIRGDAPETQDAKQSSKQNKSEEAKAASAQEEPDEGFGENRILTIALNHQRPLRDEPWPFIIDHDEFPVSLFRVQLVPGRILPYSILKAVMPLQKNLNWALTFLITQMRRTSQRKWLVNKGDFAEDEIDKLTSPESDEMIETNGASPNSLQPVDFGQLSQPPLVMLNILTENFNEISGFTEIFGGLSASRSATEASIREERAQTFVNLMLEHVEESITELSRHMLQIAFSIMNVEEVAAILGPDKVQPEQIDAAGTSLGTTSLFWNEEMTPQEIRREVDIVLVPGSTRRVNKDQEVIDAGAMLDRAMSVLAQISNQGFRVNPQGLIPYANQFIRKMMNALGWQDTEQFLLRPETLEIPEPPPAPVNLDQSVSLQEGDMTLREAPQQQPDIAAILEQAEAQGLPFDAIQQLLATPTAG